MQGRSASSVADSTPLSFFMPQVFRIKQCLSVLNLNVTQCEELFKLEDVKTDDLKKASDSLIDARLGVEYAAGKLSTPTFNASLNFGPTV